MTSLPSGWLVHAPCPVIVGVVPSKTTVVTDPGSSLHEQVSNGSNRSAPTPNGTRPVALSPAERMHALSPGHVMQQFRRGFRGRPRRRARRDHLVHFLPPTRPRG